MKSRLAIVVADGHPVVRWALCSYLERHAGLSVAAEASSRAELETFTDIHRPDVVVTELQFADGLVFDSMPKLLTVSRVLAFSADDAWEYVESFFSIGGLAFVSKRSPLHEVAEAIKAAAKDQRWVAPSVRQVRNTDSATSGGEALTLTPREREIVTLIARGYTSRQIADQLCISSKTVETHRYRVFRKLRIRRCAQLTDYAIRNGLN